MLLNEKSNNKINNTQQKKVTDELKKQISKFRKKLSDKDMPKAKQEFNRILTVLYKKKSGDIGDEVNSVFEVVRMAIVIGVPFCIHPALGLVTYIIDKVISEKVNEKYEKRIIGSIDRSIELCDEKLKKEDIEPESKKELEKMKTVLKTRKNNAENYFMQIKDYKYKETDDDEDSADGWDI